MLNIDNFKDKSNMLNSKLYNLNSLGVNCKIHMEELDSINKRFDGLISGISSSFGNTAVQSAKVNELAYEELVSDFMKIEQKAKCLYMQYDMENICAKIDDNIDEENNFDINEYVKKLCDFLNFFANINQIDYPELDNAFKSIYSALYKLIKLEIRQNGKSKIFTSLLNSGFKSSYFSNLINEDITNLTDKDAAIKIKEIIKKNPMSNNINLEIITLLAINEGTFKEDISNDVYQILTELKDKTNTLDEMTGMKSQQSDHSKKYIEKKLIDDIKQGLIYSSIILANITAVIIPNALICRQLKKDGSIETYNTTSAYYDTINGENGTSENYIENPVLGNAIVKIYYPTREDGTRYEEIYLFEKNQYDTPEEYYNADKSDAILKFSGNTLDENANKISNDEFATSEVITSINNDDMKYEVNDEFDKKDVAIITCVLHFLILLVTVVINMIMYNISEFDLFTAVDSKIHKYNIFASIKEYIDNLNKLEGYNPKLYKKLKKEIESINKDYETLIEKYSFMKDTFKEKGLLLEKN